MDFADLVWLVKMSSCGRFATPVKMDLPFRFCFLAVHILILWAALLFALSEMGGFAAFS